MQNQSAASRKVRGKLAAARYAGISLTLLNRMMATGRGPRGYKLSRTGRRVSWVFRVEDLDLWLESFAVEQKEARQ